MKLGLLGKTGTSASVTVVIPCYKYGHFLPQAVASVLAQPDVDARVIIVDDCSPDDSLEVARALAAADGRVQVIAHEVNRGHIRTYNDGLDAVTTKYVTLVSADDLVAPGALARAVALMEREPTVGMVYGWPVEFSGEPPAPKSEPRTPVTYTRWRGREYIGLMARRGRNFILSPEVVMRTEALRQIGGYNAELPHSGDLEFWLRTAARWDVGRVNGRVQAYYRQHGQNMHATTFAGMPADLRHRLTAFEYLLSDDFAEASPSGETYLRQIRRAMSAEAVGLAIDELDSVGDEALAVALVDTATDLAGRRLPGRQSRRFARRLSRVHAGRAPGVTHTTRLRLLRFGNRFRWRFWAMTGVS